MKIFMRIWFWGVVILIGFLVWFFVFRETALEYETVAVARGDVVSTIDVSATLEPKESVEAGFEVSGTAEFVAVSVGDRVSEGDVLAVLDDSILQRQIEQGITRVELAYQDEKLARRTWDEMKPEQREVKKLATELARRELSALYAQLDKYTLLSPISGTITEVNVEEGEVATVAQPIVRIVGSEDLHLSANVPESDIVELVLNQEAEFTLDALTNDEKFVTTIDSIEPEATVIQDVVYYKVEFSLKDMDPRFKSGMSADVVVEIDRKDNTLYLPRRTVRENDSGEYVEVVGSDNMLEERFVTTGLEDDEGNVEILSGVKKGELVVL